MRAVTEYASVSERTVRACEPLIDVATASKILGLSRRVITTMAVNKDLPGTKIGRYWKFRESMLDAWVRSRLESCHSQRPSQESRSA